jgi:hypothetical protein
VESPRRALGGGGRHMNSDSIELLGAFKDDLIANKRAVARPRHFADIAYLEGQL